MIVPILGIINPLILSEAKEYFVDLKRMHNPLIFIVLIALLSK